MRVPSYAGSVRAVQNLNDSLGRVQNYQMKLITGKRINLASDNPHLAARALTLSSNLESVENYQSGVAEAKERLNTMESAMTGSLTSLMQAQSAIIRGLNDATLNQGNLDALAEQVEGALNHLYNLSNTKDQGKTIFSGFQTLNEAFTATMTGSRITAVNYTGDNGQIQVEVGDGYHANVNLTGSDVFQQPSADLFNSLIVARDALETNNMTALENGLDELQAGMEHMRNEIARLGTWSAEMQEQENRLMTMKNELTGLLSQTVDADLAEAATQYQKALNIYEAGLSSSSRLVSLGNLAQYLR